MTTTICASAPKCPIFNGLLQERAVLSDTYKRQFCKAGEKGWTNCRRWQCKQKYGKVPENLLPNSFKSIEAIGEENNW